MKTAPTTRRQTAVWNLPPHVERNIKKLAEAEGRSVSSYLKQLLIKQFGSEKVELR